MAIYFIFKKTGLPTIKNLYYNINTITQDKNKIEDFIYGENKYLRALIEFIDAICNFINKCLGRHCGNPFSSKEANEDLMKILTTAGKYAD